MPADFAQPGQTAELVSLIERHINGRTWGQVHHLAVQVDGDQVLVQGLAPSYYVKQLAIQGILEGLDGAAPGHLQVDIEVESASP